MEKFTSKRGSFSSLAKEFDQMKACVNREETQRRGSVPRVIVKVHLTESTPFIFVATGAET
jgi:hypothetical protein